MSSRSSKKEDLESSSNNKEGNNDDILNRNTTSGINIKSFKNKRWDNDSDDGKNIYFATVYVFIADPKVFSVDPETMLSWEKVM